MALPTSNSDARRTRGRLKAGHAALWTGAALLCASAAGAQPEPAEPEEAQPEQPAAEEAKPEEPAAEQPQPEQPAAEQVQPEKVVLEEAEPKPKKPKKKEKPAQVPGFVCLGEAESVMRGTSVEEIEMHIDRRLTALQEGKVVAPLRAHYHCVIGTMMRRLGDSSAQYHYEKAIELNPREPAYELWYAQYFQWTRGAGGPVTESAERRNYAALRKGETFRAVTQVGEMNEVLRDWTGKNLAGLYVEDGLPLLPWNWKAYPYDNYSTQAPQLFFALAGTVARDTNDIWELSDIRRFTTEGQTVADRRALIGGITDDHLNLIARAPVRYDAFARLRLRQNVLGAVDAFVRRAELLDSQISDFANPGEFHDVKVEDVGFAYRRALNLYPVFDVTLNASVTLQERTGVVEGEPDLVEDITIFNIAPTISRHIGPDKLTIGGAYVVFDQQDSHVGALDAIPRERVIRTAFIDYAIYRPLVIPQLDLGTWTARRVRTRGWHFWGMVFTDDEQFGGTVVRKTDWGWGTVYKGWADGWWDLLYMGTLYKHRQELFGENRPHYEGDQIRTGFRFTRRLIDADRNPGLPTGPFASMQLVFPVRWDKAINGPTDFESVRGGIEWWSILFAKPLRGTSLLVNASLEYQYYYNIQKGFPVGQVGIRMGWPSMGNMPAFM